MLCCKKAGGIKTVNKKHIRLAYTVGGLPKYIIQSERISNPYFSMLQVAQSSKSLVSVASVNKSNMIVLSPPTKMLCG